VHGRRAARGAQAVSQPRRRDPEPSYQGHIADGALHLAHSDPLAAARTLARGLRRQTPSGQHSATMELIRTLAPTAAWLRDLSADVSREADRRGR
jgi:hypothetical protein